MSIGDRILFVRQRLKLNQVSFAKMIGVGQQSISFYEKGRTIPTLRTLKKIAEAGGVDVEWLKSGEGIQDAGINNEHRTGHAELESNATPAVGQFIPVINNVSAGSDTRLIYTEENVTEQIFVPLTTQGIFAFKVEGDSMYNPLSNKSITAGDYVVINPQEVPIAGDVVVVKTKAGRILVKQLKNDNGSGMILRSWNQEYEDLKLDHKEIEVIGRVIGIQPKMIRY